MKFIEFFTEDTTEGVGSGNDVREQVLAISRDNAFELCDDMFLPDVRTCSREARACDNL